MLSILAELLPSHTSSQVFCHFMTNHIKHFVLLMCLGLILHSNNVKGFSDDDVAKSTFHVTNENQQELADNKVNQQTSKEASLLRATSLMDKARDLYDQKRFLESETYYLKALDYLHPINENQKRIMGTAFHQLGQIHKRLSQLDKSAAFHQKALSIHQSLKDTQLISRSLKNTASAQFKQSHYFIALDYALEGLALQEQLDNPEEHAEYLTLLGMIYRNLYRYETSLDYTNKAFNIYMALGNLGKIADSYNQLGLLYTRLQNYQQARSYYQMSLDLLSDEVPSKHLATAYRESAAIELKNKNYTLALKLADKAYAIYKNDSNTLKLSNTTRIIGDIYYASNNTQQAKRYYQDALSFAKQANSKIDQVKTLNQLAIIASTQNSNTAIAMFKESLEITQKLDFIEEQVLIYKGLMSIAENQEKFALALDYSKKLATVTALINDRREQNKLAYAKAKLDSHFMKTELNSLKKQSAVDKLTLDKQNSELEIAEKNRRIAELELVKNRYSSTFLAILLFTCLCVAIYIYRIFISSKKRNRELSHIATHDSLTHCLNRRGLFQRMERQISKKPQIQQFAVVLADIDFFKDINDKYGHDKGDKVLSEFSKVLKSCVNQGDIVSRYGGEEFCLILNNLALDDAKNLSENLRKTIQANHFDGVSITCSFGIAHITEAATAKVPLTELISRADKALYRSKEIGRNTISVWKK